MNVSRCEMSLANACSVVLLDSAATSGNGAPDHGDEISVRDDVTLRNHDRRHGSLRFREHRNLHLHGLHDRHGVTLTEGMPRLGNDSQHGANNLGPNLHRHPRILPIRRSALISADA